MIYSLMGISGGVCHRNVFVPIYSEMVCGRKEQTRRAAARGGRGAFRLETVYGQGRLRTEPPLVFVPRSTFGLGWDLSAYEHILSHGKALVISAWKVIFPSSTVSPF